MKLFSLLAVFAFSTAQAYAQAFYSGQLSAVKDKHLIGPIQLRVQSGTAEIHFGGQQQAKASGTFSAKDGHSFQAEFKIPRGGQMETVHLHGQVLGQKIKARFEVDGYPEGTASADLELLGLNGVMAHPQATTARQDAVIDDYDGRVAAERFLDLLAPRH